MNVYDFLNKEIEKKTKILLMFNYDGTLTPLTDNPENAKLTDSVKNDIKKLAKNDFINVSIITGRKTKDFFKVSKLKSQHIEVFGLYGGECYENGKLFLNASTSKKNQLKELDKNLKDINKLNGISVENKDYTFKLNYKKANEKTAQKAINLFIDKVKNLSLSKDFKFQKGQKIIELVPQNFDKLNAVRYLINKHFDSIPIYFGDDESDIYAVREVKKYGGFSVGIGHFEYEKVDEKLNIKLLHEIISKLSSKL